MRTNINSFYGKLYLPRYLLKVVVAIFVFASGASGLKAQEDSADTTTDTTLNAVADTSSDSTSDTTSAEPAPLPDFVPLPDRWRSIVTPPYEINVKSNRWYDPYNQNVLKGDYPIWGQNTFLILTAQLQSVTEFARVPTPSGISTADHGKLSFFGDGERLVLIDNVNLLFELYSGDVAFEPRRWEIKIGPSINFNYVNLKENNNVNINVRKNTNRTKGHIAFQELSLEKHLFNLSDRFDFVSARVGIQKFGSDFRDFIFKDNNLGFRIFGNAGGNRVQYNAAYFYMLEKETNSELNTIFDDRNQQVFIFNIYKQDLFTLGYTGQLSFHYNRDKSSIHFDENGVPVRPSVIGSVRPHNIRAYYAGWTGDGHLGRLNINHAAYYVFGTDDFNSVAGRAVDIDAQMFALELSVDYDWMRYKVSAFFASGDPDPMDGKAEGFDAIIDLPFFAGGPFSWWNQQGIRLQGVNLVNKFSLLPNLRPNKFEGQANFVNPGLFLFNVGYDAELTPKLKTTLNLNYLRFSHVETLENFLNQGQLDPEIGIDYSLGVIYRPFLNNNAIFLFGASGLTPLEGFKDIYESEQTLFSFFTSFKLTY
ncbi:MAG: hypothetical protein IIB00_04550 [candidate division Zixibacteria bacterium]|nr:hypothetical protein [candidate division Zixibacteria bacterium]